ncbi:MAG: sugar kinase [Defluviitaleaceae bacterium]|nr:sugar kinase [Defluviitaleaceae bacterium]
MAKVLLIGEPMALLMANTVGPLEEVDSFTRKLAGAEVNVCIGLTRLGHEATYVTRLGRDPFGIYAKTTLENEGIRTDFITFDDLFKTGLMLKGKVLAGDPPTAYYRKGSAASKMTPEQMDQIDLTDFDLVHLTGILPALSLACRAATQRLMARAKKAGITVSFDPNLRPTLWEGHEVMTETLNDLAKLADIVLPGIEEGLALMGSSDPVEIADFYQNLGAKQVVVKVGPEGAYARDGAQSMMIPGFKVKTVVDTVGAGDGFATGVISGLIEGLSLNEAVLRGNAIGSIQVQHPSDNEGLPTRRELDHYMS